MKRFCFIAVALFISALVYGNAIGAPVLSIGDYDVLPGGTVTAEISIADIEGTGADTYSFRLGLDLSSSALVAANPVRGPATPVDALITNINAGSNRIDFFYSVFSPNPPELTNGVLATVDITVPNSPGAVFPLVFGDVSFSDGVDPVSVNAVDGSIAVVPIPSAILLLGGGLISLFAIRRRRP
jgi:hypothetical protein